MTVASFDIQIIRGDAFELSVGLGQGFEDAVANPTGYTLRMGLRMDQLDTLPVLLLLTSTVEVVDPDCDGYRLAGTFTATPAQTTALPGFDLVHYVELVDDANAAPTRLFQGRVKMRD